MDSSLPYHPPRIQERSSIGHRETSCDCWRGMTQSRELRDLDMDTLGQHADIEHRSAVRVVALIIVLVRGPARRSPSANDFEGADGDGERRCHLEQWSGILNPGELNP